MYERFISSSMLTGTLFGIGVVMLQMPGPLREAQAYVRGASPAEGRPAWWLHIQIANVECVVRDELAAGLDLVAHECGEHLVGLRVIFRTDLQERPNIRIHGRRPERVRVHLAQALVAVDGDPLLAGGDEVLDEIIDIREGDVRFLAPACARGR